MRWWRWASAARRRRGPLLAAAAVMCCGVALRAGTFAYHGAPTQAAYSGFAVGSLGGYSGIAALYFRDHMWLHQLPYVHYPLEYPVGTGLFAWLAAAPGGGIAAYFTLSALALAVCGLLAVWALGRLRGARPWLFALSPALALYVVQSWDLLSLAGLLVALVLFERRRDRWGAGVLALATWTKFFPILALPVVLSARLLEHQSGRQRVRAAADIILPFALVSVAINAPFALHPEAHGGLAIAPGWLYFFTFNSSRPLAGTNLWTLIFPRGVALAELNALCTALTISGMALALGGLAWASRRRGTPASELLLPAALACIAWFMFANKVYSPQYGLWVIALLAAAGAPLALAIVFAAADLGFYITVFITLAIPRHNPARGWAFSHLVKPANALVEGLLLAAFAWALWALMSREHRHALQTFIRLPRRGKLPGGPAVDSDLGQIANSPVATADPQTGAVG